MPWSYYFENIRTLLTEGFSDEELRNFCFDTPAFRPVHNQLSQGTGKAEIIRRLIEYAGQKREVEVLLAWAKRHNPDTYGEFGPYHYEEVKLDKEDDKDEGNESRTNGLHSRSRLLAISVLLLAVALIGTLLLATVKPDSRQITPSHTPISMLYTMTITISSEKSEPETIRATQSSPPIDSRSVKGDTPITISVQVSNQYGTEMAPNTLSYHWELCCGDVTNTPTPDDHVNLWVFRLPTYLLTETLTINVSDGASHSITATIPFTITER
jgi:hypothetical protein